MLNIRGASLLTTLFSYWLIVSFAPVSRNFQTECISLETDGYVTIKIWNTKKGSKYTVEQARKDAVAALLYSGIAGVNGCITQPPILNNADCIDNFHNIEEEFWAKNGKWNVFTRNATIVTAIPQNIGDKRWKVYQVSVSKSELRKYLEEQKVIKSLNSGF